MTYRLLDVDSEWPLIEHEFTSRGAALPDPRLAMIVGAFNNDDPPTLLGFLVCQLQFHMEPLVLYSPVVLPGLLEAMERELGNARYFAFSDNELTSRICLHFGMTPVSSLLFFKDLSAPISEPLVKMD